MQQRCDRVGGELTITSLPGQGTAIVAVVPVVPSAATKGKSPEIPMSQTSAIRVLVVDDHPVVRRGLVTLLNLEPGVTMVAEASDGPEAVAQFRIHQPDVTLMDLRLPRMNGVEALATIRQEFASARILILTTYDGDEDIYRGLRAGALGYLLKDASCEQILSAIRTVHQGQKYLPVTVGVKRAERINSPQLSEREREVLLLLTQGKSNQEIGTALGIAEGTVKFHLNKILLKLGVSDLTQAVIAAFRRGIASP